MSFRSAMLFAVASSLTSRRVAALSFRRPGVRAFGSGTGRRRVSLGHRRRRPLPDPTGLYEKLHADDAAAAAAASALGSTRSAEDPTAADPPTTAGGHSLRFPLRGADPDDAPPRLRFAPSPTGSLHVGGARTALYNYLLAKKGQRERPASDAGFVLRVEDTDLARSTRESEESVLADLAWLGLHWDEGPDGAGGSVGPYRQSERAEIYSELARRLMEEGNAYPCFCTKEELEAQKAAAEAAGLPPRYDGTWRDADPALVAERLAAGTPHTVRFKVAPGSRVVIDDAVRGTVGWDADATVGDFVLLRSSGVPVYNFCVAVDDSLMGVTTVIRAEEHLTNTLRQALILDALGAPRPRYAHCSLILGEDKNKLSKRHGATSCNDFRLQGFMPDAMINYLCLLGWNDGTNNEIFTRDELIEGFDLSRVIKSPAVFDIQKLRWINGQHLKKLTLAEVEPLVLEQLQINDVLSPDADPAARDRFVTATTSLAKEMMETTKDAVTNALTVLDYGLPSSFDALEDEEAKTMIRMGHFYNLSAEIVSAFRAGAFPLPDPSNPLAAFDAGRTKDDEGAFPASYKAFMKSLAKKFKIKGKCLFHPVRLALTGEMSGQDVTKQLSLLSFRDVLNPETANLVPLSDRVDRLEAFLDTVPEEYRAPPSKSQSASDADAQQQQSPSSSSSSSAAASAEEAFSYDGPPITALDVRVGKILSAHAHPEAEKLYCSTIDVGEDAPRTVASGLRAHYADASELVGRAVLVVTNLKPRKMLGFRSHGMVLCATSPDGAVTRAVAAPADAPVGERVAPLGVDAGKEENAPWTANKVGKKKVLEKIVDSGFFVTDERTGTVRFGPSGEFLTSAGVCTSTVRGGTVS